MNVGQGGEEEQNSPSSIGSLSHSGSDNEYDYEGGMYCTSKDPVYAAVCATDQWLKWGGSAGNLYWTARKYKWTVWDYQKSTWEKDDAGFDGGVDITHYFVTTNAYGDYYNWNWNGPDKKTTAHHRLRLSGAHSGYIDWGSDHWHTGEDAGNLWAEVGPHSKYP